ncbi:hypothetical protein HUN01_32745 [Nostoc edaphicum CCNP1411]|uniref:Uncharacterized protein n=1 Tax=Nostoc edaphicum CCNP1411 TaxID=1472755 RepID=A0A7D7LF92_9NOSO|nr:hypothetical protein [Nostoc edaphicum]QMS92136.1 hypothetical protein HUN01_32745 [Nostoc edaphicum CCNP1411]
MKKNSEVRIQESESESGGLSAESRSDNFRQKDQIVMFYHVFIPQSDSNSILLAVAGRLAHSDS